MAPSSGTPSRDRQTSTHRSPAGATGSSSSSSVPSHTPASPVALDALIAAHSRASDPKMAALEALAHERDTLSGQNAQLWKLIEKQRSGYNQILKELERVRGERDAYRARLGVNPAERRHRTQSADDEALASRSDDHAGTPRAASTTPSRSHEYQRSFKSPPPPASAPTRVDSAPPAATSRPFPTSESPHPRQAGLPNGGSRKSSFAESIDSSTSSHPVLHHSSSSLTSDYDAAQPAPISTNPSLLFVDSHSVARDSRISLPDEAKKYIASMGESPVPSPRPGATFAAQTSSARLGQVSEQANAVDSGSDDDDGDAEMEDPRVEEQFEVLVTPDTTDVPTPNGFANRRSQHSDAEQVAPTESTSTAVHDKSHHHHSTGSTATYRPTEEHATPSGKHEKEKEKELISFHALPLLSSDLPHTTISVLTSFVRPNDRGKDVLTFTIIVFPGGEKRPWKVEKLYSDVIGLDQRVRATIDRKTAKKVPTLPDGRIWRDHAPVKADQRKMVLEGYLQALIRLPVKNNDEVIAFFTKDIVREQKQPVLQSGHKEGYLTKRGKNFGGWKTRYFLLSGPVLEYYDCRGGAHLGSITVTGAQIGRQTSQAASNAEDADKEFRHAFLIVEQKKGPGGNHPRHVLCAESDAERDAWVDMLVRYFSGKYSETGVAPPSSSADSMTSTSSTPRKPPVRALSRDDIAIAKGSAVPISQLTPDNGNAKLFTSPTELPRSSSPSSSVKSPVERPSISESHARKLLDRNPSQPSSLPDTSSPIAAASASSSASTPAGGPRANSEMGHYPDLQEYQDGRRFASPERHRTASDNHNNSSRKMLHPTGHGHAPVTPERAPSPEKSSAASSGDSRVKISGPLNGAPIPAGYKFGGIVATGSSQAPVEASPSTNDRREKAKSRSFWGFGKQAPSMPPAIPKAVFGVPLEESLEVASIASLPAIVFRAIQYLETKQAEMEEGIYRLSGSSAVIKMLKDRFNMEGDVDLLASDDYWDPHAISGLLKSFLRELPASILTRELHLRFLAVIDFVDPQERIRELSQLIAALPIANYSLLRALTAHLILIVQNCGTNKMTMRNVGIVFSPTLGIPAGVLSLMLGEFNRVFNVDDTLAEEEVPAAEGGEMARRNSQRYSDAAADKLLGLSGRSLGAAPAEENSDEGDAESYEESSETQTLESGDSHYPPPDPPHPPNPEFNYEEPPDTPRTPTAILGSSRSAQAAAMKGLNVSVAESSRGNRYSRMMGLPASPKPPGMQQQQQQQEGQLSNPYDQTS